MAGKFWLEKGLAHEVDEGKARAKFDKAKQRLEVTLPVIPPAPQTIRSRQAQPANPPTPPQLVQEISASNNEPAEPPEVNTEPAINESELDPVEVEPHRQEEENQDE
eukprot:scaffold669772_cov32-Prasinocladus_malaysianus.AAC.1